MNDSTPTADLATIVEERAVIRQLVRVARAMDERDYATLQAILMPDASADLGSGPIFGAEKIIARIRHFLDVCGPSQHLLGNILVDVDHREGTATSRAYVNDRHLGDGDRSHLTFATLGDYHDEWIRADGIWRMQRRMKHSRGAIGTREVFARDASTTSIRRSGAAHSRGEPGSP